MRYIGGRYIGGIYRGRYIGGRYRREICSLLRIGRIREIIPLNGIAVIYLIKCRKMFNVICRKLFYLMSDYI